MPCSHKLFLALLLVEDDAEALSLHCYAFRNGRIDADVFTAGVEEIAGKLSQRARETTEGEKAEHFPRISEEDIPF